LSSEVLPRSFDSIEQEWLRLLAGLRHNSVFLTPTWQRVWWDTLGFGQKLLLSAVRFEGATVGVLPLMQQDGVITFIGDTAVCDYHDFPCSPDMEQEVFSTLVAHLDTFDWDLVSLDNLLEDSPTLAILPSLAIGRGWRVEKSLEEVSPGVQLPGDWESYLGILDKKQRHELRRKIHRLEQAGKASYFSVSDPEALSAGMDTFLGLLKASRTDKAEFLTPPREKFFRSMASALSKEGYLKLFFLELSGSKVASCICFDYNDTYSLYNSGYDPAHASLSVGVLLKAFCIKDAIEHGKKTYDFLRGAETYKYHLGGQDKRLYRLTISRH